MNIIRCALLPVLALAASAVSARTIEVEVNGLVCAFCAQGIEKTLKTFPAATRVFVSLENRLVAIELKDGQDIADAAVSEAIEDAGYRAVDIRRTDNAIETLRARTKEGGDE